MANYASFREVVDHTAGLRREFFRLVFGNETGYVCIAYKNHTTNKMVQEYFLYPDQLDIMCASVDDNCQNLIHAYFCVNLLTKPERVSENVEKSTVAWVDLDKCNPVLLMVDPSITVQTSDSRWQGLWRFESPQAIDIGESISRRIAYYHAEQGSDKGCWNRTRLFRIPYTPNYKYGDIQSAPVVVVTNTVNALYRESDFVRYPELTAFKFASKPVPQTDNFLKTDEDPESIIARFDKGLQSDTFGLYRDVPDRNEDWSGRLWNLEKRCVEAGMTLEETYRIASTSACNKYKRDGRPDRELWAEVKKAHLEDIEQHNMAPTATSTIPELMTDEEIKMVQGRETFIERYISWASGVTDASIQFHQAGAFIILSSIMSSTYKLPTSFGDVAPNMWFYLCANTTLCRKTTSMNLAMKLLEEVNPEAVMATDGSVEGILTALMHRPGQSSIYLRDEFTGLLEAMSHKDYMAGMAEAFTKLYDGGSIKRMLKKEEIKVSNPIFIMFAGGVKTKTQMMLTEEHINSGFIPRWVFITAEPDPSKIRPVGPPRPVNNEERDLILNELHVLNEKFNTPRHVVGHGSVLPIFEASLTNEAWIRYNDLENTFTKTALDSGIDHLTPVYDRLAKSTLKAAMLIAASRSGESSDIVIGVDDILHAIYYCRMWYKYVSEIVNGVGKNYDERLIDAIIIKLHEAGDFGLTRAQLMKEYTMDVRRADLIFATMEQRGIIRKTTWRTGLRYHLEL